MRILKDDTYYNNIQIEKNELDEQINILRQTRDKLIKTTRDEYNSYIRLLNKKKRKMVNLLTVRQYQKNKQKIEKIN